MFVTRLYSKLVILVFLSTVFAGPEEEAGVRYADRCEVCKILATELQARLTETGKSHDVIETGYSLDDKAKKRTPYKTSQLRLIDSSEGVCDRILKYNIHKERKDSTRFAKGMSQTFQTLHGLVNKGVKVELGIPYEIWDNPSVEVTNMKLQCDALLEKHENVIKNWYFEHQEDASLIKYFCEDRALKGMDTKCLYETLEDAGETKEETEIDEL